MLCVSKWSERNCVVTVRAALKKKIEKKKWRSAFEDVSRRTIQSRRMRDTRVPPAITYCTVTAVAEF